MSRSGPPDAPLPGPGDYERIPGIGRGQARPGAGVYGQHTNVGGILPSGGRGIPLDLATPIFMAAGAANYLNGMQGVAPGGVSFNHFGGEMAGMNANQGFGVGNQGLPVPPPGGGSGYLPDAAAAAASAAQVNAFAGLGTPAQTAVRGVQGEGATMAGAPAAAAISLLAMTSPTHGGGSRGFGMGGPLGVAAARPATANPALPNAHETAQGLAHGQHLTGFDAGRNLLALGASGGSSTGVGAPSRPPAPMAGSAPAPPAPPPWSGTPDPGDGRLRSLSSCPVWCDDGGAVPLHNGASSGHRTAGGRCERWWRAEPSSSASPSRRPGPSCGDGGGRAAGRSPSCGVGGGGEAGSGPFGASACSCRAPWRRLSSPAG